MTAWSHLYFLNYGYYDVKLSLKFIASPFSKCKTMDGANFCGCSEKVNFTNLLPEFISSSISVLFISVLCYVWWCTHIRQHFMMCLIFLAKICLIPGRRIKVYKKGTTNKKKSWFIYYSITLPKYVELFTYSYYVGTLQIVSWYVVIFHVLLLNLLLWASLILYLDQSYISNAASLGRYLFKFYVKNLFIKIPYNFHNRIWMKYYSLSYQLNQRLHVCCFTFASFENSPTF